MKPKNAMVICSSILIELNEDIVCVKRVKMQFDFFIFHFLAKTIKTASFLIQTVIFKFKLKTWTNLRTPHHYRPGAPTVISTDHLQ
jgi:hypothetical protein